MLFVQQFPFLKKKRQLNYSCHVGTTKDLDQNSNCFNLISLNDK